MAILTRKTQPVFALAAADIGQFGSGQLGTNVLTTDPAVVMAASAGAAWAGGWLDAVLGANKFPPLEEMNGIAFVCTYQLAYLLQEGIPEYDAGTTYYQHSIVKKSGTYQIYGSVTNANIGHALTDPTNWLLLQDLSGNSGAIKSLTVQEFTSSGTYTPPANLVVAHVRQIGGGGGGGGAPNTGGGGGGGGAGGYLEVLLSPAQIGASQAITIGAGGTAGANTGGAGGAGGNTTFGTLLTSNGGGGGAGGAGAVGVAGGTGGAVTIGTGTGILQTPGRPGGMGGQTGIAIGGAGGGVAPMGTGGQMVVAFTNTTSVAGLAPNGAVGGGGGGAANNGGGGAQLGGAGTGGYVVVIEYKSV